MSWGKMWKEIKTFINLKFKVVTLNDLLPTGILPHEQKLDLRETPLAPSLFL